MRILKWIFSILLLGTAVDAIAMTFESFPEYTTLTEDEEARYEKPNRLDSQYAAATLSYSKPTIWEYWWLTHKIAFDGTTGSLDGTTFLINSRAKIHKLLSDQVEFRFTYFEERTLERDSVHHILELVYWVNPKVGFAVYGEPSFYKRQNDVGLAFLYRPESRHEIRIFNTWVDIVRNDRNDRTDRYEDNFPYSMGLVGRFYSEGPEKNFVEYSIRQDTNTRWLFPDEGYEYHYWKKVASVSTQQAIGENMLISGQLQYDQKYEAKTPYLSYSTTTPENWTTDRFQSVLRTTFLKTGPNGMWELTPGIAFNVRDWKSNLGQVTYVDYVPHIIWVLPGFGKGPNQDTWTLEYDLTLHRQGGKDYLRSRPNVDNHIEQRFDASYDFAFNDNAYLKLLGTFDIGRLFKGKPWGGGNAMLRVDF